MRSLVPLTFGLATLAATPATSQSLPALSSFADSSRDAHLAISERNFAFRVNDVINADGSRRKRTAIIAGIEVAPATTVGFGLFDTLPKARGRGPDPRLDGMAKKSRKAAIGMTFRF